MAAKYTPTSIEKKWQEAWEQAGLYRVEDAVPGKENFYQLVEFSYPSGNLHVGHWYAFSVPDIHARFLRMQGKNVLYPMGFDAFGLPAENAAIKNSKDPREWTYANMAHMEQQLRSMGAIFDWSRKVVTCDPAYYRWTQWLFLELFKAGLVEQKETLANWCSSCKTVLANEQVVNNTCERCGSDIQKKTMLQWQVKITQYADRLIDDLANLDWAEEIKTAQKNWIGRSEGAEIDFPLVGRSEAITVFTTRPDTLYGVTYMVLAPEHSLLTDLQGDIENFAEVATYQALAKKKSEIERTNATKEKTGVELKGIRAINPATGEEIPVFVADYVLVGYGTGAIMAVPAHDERDFAFAKQYALPIKQVAAPCYNQQSGECFVRHAVYALLRNNKSEILLQYYENAGYHWLPGGGLEEGESLEEGLLRELREETGYTDIAIKRSLGKVVYNKQKADGRICYNIGHVFEAVVLSDLRENIELMPDEIEDGLTEVWLKEEDIEKEFSRGDAERAKFIRRALALEKTEFVEEADVVVNSEEFTGMKPEEAKSKIIEKVGGRMTKTYRLRDWGVSRQRYWGCPIPLIHCEACGWQAVPDKDLPVMLPEVDNYLPNDNGQSPLSKNSDFVNTICPGCGGAATRETDTLDTFVDSSWYFLRYCDALNTETFASKEALTKWMPVDLYSGGAEHTTMHLLYSRFFHKALFDLGLVNESEPYAKRMNRGLILGPDGNKMSKSKGNVIDPDAIVAELGADTMRMYLAFIGPYNETGNYPWNPESVIGVYRFLERVWRLQEKVTSELPAEQQAAIESSLHKALAMVSESIASMKMNTGVAALMTCSNELRTFEGILPEHLALYVQMFAPYAPHIADELWQILGNVGSVHQSSWPVFDATKSAEATVQVAVQVNGKVRGLLILTGEESEAEVRDMALADSKVAAAIGENQIKKVIIIPRKIVSIVV